MAAGFERLSPESRYRRFFHRVDHLSVDQLTYLTELDFRDHVAWIAVGADEPDEPIVGVARWVRAKDDPSVAEAAVVVGDPYHRHGVGKTLLWLISRAAIERGVRAFRVWVLPENRPVLDLLAHVGAKPGRWESGVLDIEVPLPDHVDDLDATPAPLVLRAAATGEVVGHAKSDGLGTHLRAPEPGP